MSTSNLWSGMRIPIVMVSGPVNSGKTLFGLTIDPNCRRAAADVQPTTLVYDQEGSAEPYVGGLNFDWKDTRAAVAAGVHSQRVAAGPEDPRWLRILKETADCNDNPSAAMFRAWYLSILNVPAGRYAVGVCDTFTPLQDGMVEWARRHPEAFGYTHSQFDKASSMFLWPTVKSILSHILTIDCRLRFQTFVLNVHLKNEWSGGSKTGKQVAEGLDVLEKLATLHLELDRSPTAKGKEAPRVPAAIVKKERLVRFGAVGGSDLPVLPPRVPHCTPDAIRKYIDSPPDFGKLEAGERLPDQSMSDDEKLRLQASIAENQRAAEESKLSALEMARRAAEAGRYQTTVTVQHEAAATSAASNGHHAATAGPALLTAQQAKDIMGLLRELFSSGAEAQQYLAAKHQVANPAAMTEPQAMTVLADLYAMKSDRQMPPTPAANAEAQHANGSGPATQQQRDKIREMTVALYGDQAGAENNKFLARFGYSAGMSLKWCEAEQRILELQGLLQPTAVGAGEECPFDGGSAG